MEIIHQLPFRLLWMVLVLVPKDEIDVLQRNLVNRNSQRLGLLFLEGIATEGLCEESEIELVLALVLD